MARNPEKTRTNIMNAAEALILEYGFAGSTVNDVIEKAGVTKGAFFHHFPTKVDLGHALVERYADLDRHHLESTMERAEKLSRDPLQQVLIFVGLLMEEMESLAEPFPGCLFASYCYQKGLFDDGTLEIAREAMRAWRDRIAEKLREAARQQSLREYIDFDTLADMLMTIFEGAFVLSTTFDDPRLVADQLGHYRRYVELLFTSGLEIQAANA